MTYSKLLVDLPFILIQSVDIEITFCYLWIDIYLYQMISVYMFRFRYRLIAEAFLIQCIISKEFTVHYGAKAL